jgi:hypothetical protein
VTAASAVGPTGRTASEFPRNLSAAGSGKPPARINPYDLRGSRARGHLSSTCDPPRRQKEHIMFPRKRRPRQVTRPRSEAEQERDEAEVIEALTAPGDATIAELSVLLDIRSRLISHTLWRLHRAGIVARVGGGRYALCSEVTVCANREEPYCWVWPDGYDDTVAEVAE